MDLVERLRAATASAMADPTRSEWSVAMPTRQLLSDIREPVGVTPDLTRVSALPSRPPPDLDGAEGAALVELAVRRWGVPRAPGSCLCQVPVARGGLGRDYCVERPFPVQAWAMHEMSLVGGLLGPIVTGGGKSFLDIMAAMAVPGVRLAVLLIPPSLRAQIRREYFAVAQHFVVPNFIFGPGDHSPLREGAPIVHVVPYSIFSRPESTALLERLAPDLVIADEAQCVANREASRTVRLFRYWVKNKGTRLAAWSGTLVSDSLGNVAPLSALALKTRSPLPLDPAVVEEWALAVDPTGYPSPPGALGDRFGLPVRRGLNRRIVETLGVVSSPGASISTPLRILDRVPPAVPEKVADALDLLRSKRKRPDGEELVEDLEVAACAQQLSAGFYYRWRFPHGEPDELILEWFAARKDWAAELRDKLSGRRENLDSPRLCQDAAERHHGTMPKVKGLPTWEAHAWPRWAALRGQVRPVPGDPVWVDDWLARDAAAWATARRGVVWYGFGAFGARVAELLGVHCHGGGPGANARLMTERGDRSIVASMKAHGTGTDGLQRLFSECLLANAVSSGRSVEQVLGRLHRPGQKAGEVCAWKYGHTPEVVAAWAAAYEKAEFIQDLLHGEQKLVQAALTDTAQGVD